jgi:hypothetical protein
LAVFYDTAHSHSGGWAEEWEWTPYCQNLSTREGADECNQSKSDDTHDQVHGVAMGAGTDVARESADIVPIGNDLMKFVETVRIARNCRRIIFQNFYGTLIVDAIGIGLAAVGLLNPLLAAFIHVASELTFILNSTRLLPREKKMVCLNPSLPPWACSQLFGSWRRTN